MKNKTTNSIAAASAPSENINSDDVIPQKIIEAAGIDSECDRLKIAIEETETIAERATAELSAALLDADLNNSKDLQLISVLQIRSVLAPQRVELLEERLAAAQKSLKEASGKAGHNVNSACEEAARGHQEIAAQAIVSHFGSLKDARRASSETAPAIAWLERRVDVGFDYGANMKRVWEVAQAVFPELKKLREKLGGSIPSGAEMNEV